MKMSEIEPGYAAAALADIHSHFLLIAAGQNCPQLEQSSEPSESFIVQSFPLEQNKISMTLCPFRKT